MENFARDPGKYPIATSSGKIEFDSPLWSLAGDARKKFEEPKRSDTPANFMLTTAKTIFFVHSQMGFLKDFPLENRLLMNALDAREKGVETGDKVEIMNSSGATVAEALCSDSIVRGAVNLPEGFWYSPDIAGSDRAGSANLLTSTVGTSESSSCVMHAVPVEVRLYEKRAPKDADDSR